MRILIYGLSKSGTTFLHTMVKKSMENILHGSSQEVFEPYDIYETNGSLLYSKDGVNCHVESNDNEIVKALLDSGVSPTKILRYQDYFDKKIFIVRDPRDRFISQTLYRWHRAHNPDKNKFERILRLVRHKELYPKDIPTFFLFNQSHKSYSRFAKKITDLHLKVEKFLTAVNKDWLILKYEDLIDRNLGQLEEYLTFPVENNISVDKNHKGVIRTKSYGNWREWYSEEDVTFLKPIFKRYMCYLKYDFSDWKLEYPNSLPKSHGSEYMVHIFSGGNVELEAYFNSQEAAITQYSITRDFKSLLFKLFGSSKFK
ncbi:sulfotransferase domain-containing protein [Microbulbifer sp. DLAB2-AA]|uniref:sulfotransferase domain-containing protein n=1 Tax=Microbulbifer sp. DLAB2-AA TaxID=3243394 RepID=UPI004039E212